jgi:homoserine dehydrogenase
MRSLRLVFLGFGHVGRELARLLLAREAWLAERGLRFLVVGVSTGSRGLRADPEGLDLDALLNQPWSPLRPLTRVAGAAPEERAALIANAEADIVVEMTPLRVDLRGEPAIGHARMALEAGKHVVSANKGPVAWAYRQLDDLARREGRRFLFESAVMDGTPLFSLARRTLAGCRVLGCRGILNTTTNYVLGRLLEGQDLEGAVREAQEAGFAEADPSLDLDGWDAAVKLTCLANALMGRNLVPEEVLRQGIRDLSPEDLLREAKRGRAIRLVAEVSSSGPAQVGPVILSADDLLARASGTSSVITLTTDLMGLLSIFEHSPGLGQTAYGVFRDLLEIADQD